MARSRTSLLPLFREVAHSPSTIHHSMKLIQKQVQYLNPGQVPVMTVDQPLFAIAKEIQWIRLLLFGEDKFVVMMGALHIEMTIIKCIGELFGYIVIVSLRKHFIICH
jgi:hypothetical protein